MEGENAQDPIPIVRKKRKLTKRQRKLLKIRLENPDLTTKEVGERAGYANKQATHQAFNSPTIKELLDNDPRLNRSALADKLAEGLEAQDVRYVGMSGRRVTEKDFAVRKLYLELAFKLNGDLKPSQEQVNNFVTLIQGMTIEKLALLATGQIDPSDLFKPSVPPVLEDTEGPKP